MKVGIIGSGGREHAICFSLNNSKKITFGPGLDAPKSNIWTRACSKKVIYGPRLDVSENPKPARKKK